MIDYQQALQDPRSVFNEPSEVTNADLSKQQKLAILRQWEYDAIQLATADEENMASSEDVGTMLSRVRHEINVLVDEK